MYDPFEISGFEHPSEPIRLDVGMAFENQSGLRCQIKASEIVTAFLALECEGLVPEPDALWRKLLASEIESMPPQVSDDFAVFSQLERIPGHICDNCGSECYAVFALKGTHYKIERWVVVTTILALIELQCLPLLSFNWHLSLERQYERIRETGRFINHQSQGGPNFLGKGFEDRSPSWHYGYDHAILLARGE